MFAAFGYLSGQGQWTSLCTKAPCKFFILERSHLFFVFWCWSTCCSSWNCHFLLPIASYWQVWIVWRFKSLTLKPMPVLWYAAILVYKTVDGDKTYQKAVHLTLNGVAVLVALVGVAAAYKFHLDNKFDNFYSLHSWFGITTIIFYLVQVNSLAIMLNDSFNCQFWK